MLDLYDHNRKAYHAALSLMAGTGKAAVIHPTGTGKSIIAFKLIEDHPEKRVCWFSPSNYIVRTQRENVRRIEPNFSDENVTYCTYARLMYMDQAEVSALKPDYIVLDEFHRCGASEWGRGIASLLEQYPDVPILGLSATSIRYLDQRRDMAAELFDGNIASEMSVAEAITMGILPAPTYVIALISYQKELEKYERRVNSFRYRNNYDENAKYLEALRRALEKSDGLDKIFQKHMRVKSGKYIVFCSNREHMELVKEQIPQWFAGVDRNPHVYCVCSEDPESEQSFSDFKSDTSSHLKLLLCIDMLSEGIHVDDIAGVILLRPTTSPIVYKQQIGRALAAGKSGAPLIFDVVNNFDSLVSVSWMQEEIQNVVSFYQDRGLPHREVEEYFRIIDEVRECRVLLGELEKSLSATWDVNYDAARAYYHQYGHLNVPAAYRTENGIQLGAWIGSQRRLYQSAYRGSLTEDRIARLNGIGMVWENRYEHSWESYYQLAEEYYIEHGDLKVPRTYTTESGVLLGKWLYRQLSNYEKLPEEKIARLNAIGMNWSTNWESRYETAKDFLLSHPDYELSQSTVIGDFWVGKWLVKQLRSLEEGTLLPDQIIKMQVLVEQTGIDGQTQAQRKWMRRFQDVEMLTERYGSWKNWEETEATKPMLLWIKQQIKKLNAGQVSPGEAQLLQRIGIVSEDDSWMKYFRLAEKYYSQYGDLNVPSSYITPDGVRLGTWISRQRRLYRETSGGKGLTDQQIRMLEGLNMEWDLHRKSFETGLCAAERYYKTAGNLNVPARYVDDTGYPLYQWMCDIRKKKSKLQEQDRIKLDAMQFAWEKNTRNIQCL